MYHYTRKTLCKFFIWYVCNWSCLSLIYAFQLIDQFNETESNVRENGNDLIVPTNWHWITVNITSHHYSTWNQFDVVKTTSTQSDTTWSLFIIKLICAHRVCHTLTFFSCYQSYYNYLVCHCRFMFVASSLRFIVWQFFLARMDVMFKTWIGLQHLLTFKIYTRHETTKKNTITINIESKTQTTLTKMTICCWNATAYIWHIWCIFTMELYKNENQVISKLLLFMTVYLVKIVRNGCNKA